MYLLAISGVKPNERCVCVSLASNLLAPAYLRAQKGIWLRRTWCVCVSLASNLLVPAYLRAQKGIWL